jgi:hypothetical protein
MTPQSDSELPVTPSDEGRKAAINNFGYNLTLDELWPLALGALGTMVLGLAAVVGALPLPWYGSVFAGAAPLISAHIYLKVLVEGAPPHRQRDAFARLSTVSIAWDKAPFPRLPFIPGLRFSTARCDRPEPASFQHPMRLLEQRHRLEKLNARKPSRK